MTVSYYGGQSATWILQKLLTRSEIPAPSCT